MQKLNAHALGWAFGVMEAFFVLLVWMLEMGGMSEDLIDLIGSFYIGFDATFAGLVVGLVEALIVGFIVGWLIARLYNMKVKEVDRDHDHE